MGDGSRDVAQRDAKVGEEMPARDPACLVADSRVGVKEVFRVIFPLLV
jgi:hypothetical protein